MALVTAVGCLAIIPISADEMFSVDVTDGDPKLLTNTSVRKYWCPTREDSSVIIRLNDKRRTDGLYVSWFTDDSVFAISSYDENGEILNSYKNGDKYDGFSCFYELDSLTRKIVIEMPARESERYGIVHIELSDADNPNSKIMKWKSPDEKCDMLVIPTHQDDEFIFLGAVIPSYIAEGYNVAVTYSCICVRLRYEEGLRGLWNSGVRTYPDYLGFVDRGRKLTYDEAADVWGGEDSVVCALVREIRRKQPYVVVSHDEKGENYHNSHIVTAKSLRKAVELAASEDYDKESFDKYGAWSVTKLYLHLYEKGGICLDYNRPLDYYGGKTAYCVATESYAFHASQQSFYSLSWNAIQPGGKYDNSRFGLAYSTVGTDFVDMFYGTPMWNGKSIATKYNPVTTVQTTSENPKTDLPQTTVLPQTESAQTIKTTVSATTAVPITGLLTTENLTTSRALSTELTTSETAVTSGPITSAAVPTEISVPQTAAPSTTPSTTPQTGDEIDDAGYGVSRLTVMICLLAAVTISAAAIVGVFINRRKIK